MTTKEQSRPVLFIGSSREGLDIARAIQLNLDHEAEIILWSQGVFGLGEGNLESLVNSFRRFDFAVLILTPDDLVLSPENELPSPRDNVVFELGLFMGALGRERCFIVHDRTKTLKLPSDIAGVTAATFQPHEAGTLQSALGAPSTQILTSVRKLGRLQREPADVYIDQKTQFGIIADLLEPAIYQFFIAMYEQNALLRREGSFTLGLRYEYYIQCDKHHSQGHGSMEVNKLCDRLADAGLLQADLRGRIGLTHRGRAFAEWLVASGLKAQYFWSDVAAWGSRPPIMAGRPHPNTAPQTVFELQAPPDKPEEPRASGTETKNA